MNISVTVLIIILTCFVSYYAFSNRTFFEKLKHYPYQEYRDRKFSRLLSAGFLHGSWGHLIINMFVFWSFGQYVEEAIIVVHQPTKGRTLFLLSYLVMIVIANIPTYLEHKNNPGFASIGASGAVSGILFMYILMKPWAMLGLFFIIPCPAIVAGILYLIYSSWAAKNQNDRIDHVAHFYGALSGMLILILLRPGTVSKFIDQLTNVSFL